MHKGCILTKDYPPTCAQKIGRDSSPTHFTDFKLTNKALLFFTCYVFRNNWNKWCIFHCMFSLGPKNCWHSVYHWFIRKIWVFCLWSKCTTTLLCLKIYKLGNFKPFQIFLVTKIALHVSPSKLCPVL